MLNRMGTAVVVVALAACAPEVSVKENPNVAPTAAIVSPAQGAVFASTDTISFVGQVQDGDGVEDITSVIWASDLEGDIGESTPENDGTVRLATTVGAGTHAITVTVTDSEGERATASVTISVQGQVQNPTARIFAPQDNGLYLSNTPLLFDGQVGDLQQAPESLQVTWAYRPANGGALAIVDTTPADTSGAALGEWTTPIPGAWIIQLEAKDQDNNVGLDEVAVIVMHPDDADLDGDGYPGRDDCDDYDFDVNPGRNEVCNDIDDDCSGVIDDKDIDGDGHIAQLCVNYPGPLPIDDCNDTNAAIYTGAFEFADNADNNCDGRIDEGTNLYDDDGDCGCEHATICNGSSNVACISRWGSDCDDTDPALNQDDVDNDNASTCDGDCDDNDSSLNLSDFDNDTYTSCDGDCADFNPSIRPNDCVP